MNKLARGAILSSLFIIATTGCGLVYKVLLGVDSTPEWKTDKEIAREAHKHKISPDNNLLLDTAIYYHQLNETYSKLFAELDFSEIDSSEYFNLQRAFKDDSQPVQFRLFNKDGQEIFKIVNCYVDPPIPMDWNVDGCFDKFPPQIDVESLNSHYFNLDFLLALSSSLSQKKIDISGLPLADYYGVILWNDFFQRPSRKLIKTVQKYIEDSGQSVYLVYVNNHNAFLWQAMNAKTKEEVKQWIVKQQK
jgi:hypothetical protein